MIALGAYAGLFMSALVAATLLPMQSEAVLVGLLIAEYSPALLLMAATAGNVLGSAINWLLGRQVERFQNRSWFPASPERLEHASNWYRKYGRWSLLLSWAPIIGDPLTLVAGVLREPFWTFLLIVTVAKLGRYAVLTAVTLNLV
jgi:membrane protein YqaA with SNARE-associated domain